MIAVIATALLKTADIDPSAIALLQQVQNRMQSIRSLSATETLEIHKFKPKVGGMKETMHVRLMHPNFARVDISLTLQRAGAAPENDPNFVTYASDGKTVFRVYSNKDFAKWDCGRMGAESTINKNNMPVGGFFSRDGSLVSMVNGLTAEGLLKSISLLPGKQPGDRTIRLCHQERGAPVTRTYDISIGRNLLVHRIETRESDGSAEVTDVLTNLEVNKPLRPASFAYKLPTGARPQIESFSAPKPAFAPGTPAPDFGVETADGKSVRLSDFKGKVVVIDFWATWCGNCIDEMAFTNAIAKKYADRNVIVLAVDGADAKTAFHSWTSRNRPLDGLVFAFDTKGLTGEGPFAKLYKTGLPSQVIVDCAGRIVDCISGYEPATTKDELESTVKSALSK